MVFAKNRFDCFHLRGWVLCSTIILALEKHNIDLHALFLWLYNTTNKGKKKAFMKDKKIFLTVIFVVILGSFLRMYHFSDWLHFELDQARDAMVVDQALTSGLGNLPLQGPKAAGTFLRLGPAFYYMQYIGGLIFGNTPQGVAYPVLILSILTIPLLYLYLKRFFNEGISLSLTLIAATSPFLVMYSRFAWNPNTIPFFVILTLYALLRAVDHNEKRNNRWFFVSSASLAIAMQLHFLVFLSLPMATVAFLIFKRPKFSLKTWALSIGIFLFLFSPLIINDIKTQGANTKEFFKAITKKSGKNDAGFIEKTLRSYTESVQAATLILTGQGQLEMPSLSMQKNEKISIDVKCNQNCKNNIWIMTIFSLLITFSIVIFATRLVNERERKYKDFLILSGIWAAIVFVLYIPLAQSLSPRFFLLLLPTVFILLGILLDFFGKATKRKETLAVIVAIALSISGLVVLKQRFAQLALAKETSLEIGSDKILKERTRVTLEQQKQIAKYIESIYAKNPYMVYLTSESQYRRAILFNVGKLGVPYEDLRGAKIYRNGNYFLVWVSNDSVDKKTEKYLVNFDIAEKKQFGTLTVIHLKQKEQAITAEQQIIEKKATTKKKAAPGVPVRFNWNEVFSL